jgi:hypothetical protein
MLQNRFVVCTLGSRWMIASLSVPIPESNRQS